MVVNGSLKGDGDRGMMMTRDEPDDESGEGGDPQEEEDGKSDEGEMNEDDDASGESDEHEEESGGEEENLDEDEKESGDEDDDDDTKKTEEAKIKGFKVSSSGVTSVKPSKQESKQIKHIRFDVDEDFEKLSGMDSLVGSSKVEDGESEDSDSAPEEVTLAVGKKLADGEEIKIKKELERTKQLVKDARKRKHEKNKLQQERKRQRLENLSSKRLPEELLKAVVVEQKKQPKQKTATRKRIRKIKKFTDDHVTSSDPTGESIDEEGLITLQRGVHVRALKQETKKNVSIANQAAEFRQKALYGTRNKRMPSKELQQMKERQEKSGKNFLVTR